MSDWIVFVPQLHLCKHINFPSFLVLAKEDTILPDATQWELLTNTPESSTLPMIQLIESIHQSIGEAVLPNCSYIKWVSSTSLIQSIIQTLPSNARAARSRNALKSFICFKMPPESLLLLSLPPIRFRRSSIPTISTGPSAGLCRFFALPRSMANSISWIVALRESRSCTLI